MAYLFDPAPVFALPVKGETATYPVNRIFCVGRNYAAHAVEMGGKPDHGTPFYFNKTPCASAAHSGVTLPYPPGTENYHHEMELTFAIGTPVFRAQAETAMDHVFGYAASLDMTRRDLQAIAKEKRQPWDVAKDVEGSGVISTLTRAADFGDLAGKAIRMSVNGEVRQDAMLDDMIHSVTKIIVHLSTLYHLAPGDVIMTGTPAGVSAVNAGDVIEGHIDGLDPVKLTLSAPE